MRILAGVAVFAAALVGVAVPPAAAADDNDVVLVGDSIILGAQDAITGALGSRGWDVTFDASVSRFTAGRPGQDGVSTIRALRGSIGDTVVINLGANDGGGGAAAYTPLIDTLMAELAGVERVFWLTIGTTVRTEFRGANEAIRSAGARYGNLTVLDWEQSQAANPDFTWDGLHVRPSGAQAMADLIAGAVGSPGGGGGGGIDQPPIGALDAVTVSSGSVTALGWALDFDSRKAIDVHIYVDAAGYARTAKGSRPDVAAAFGVSDKHGFAETVPADPGVRNVCAYAINDHSAGPHTPLGCRQVTVPASVPPTGALDLVRVEGGELAVFGWALDGDARHPIDVHIYVNGVGYARKANSPRPDVGAIFGLGDNRGINARVPAGSGAQTVCAYAIDHPDGANNLLLGCQTVTR